MVTIDEITITDLEKQIKPLSQNTFIVFFQKIWRGWLNIWYTFVDKHPKLSKLVYQLAFFFIFSMSVTLFQYLVTLFLPMIMGLDLAGVEFLWPKLPMYQINGIQHYWSVLGYAVTTDSAGAVIIGGGLGYFIAFEIATFLAQVINFPLQRNITFKSHGNPAWQAMWYFIGWILVSLFCNGINSLWLPLGAEYLPFAVYNILTMFSMGGISMIIFYFIFRIIFPDFNAVEKRARNKLEYLIKNNANAEKIMSAEARLKIASDKARLSNADKANIKAKSQASSKAMAYFAIVKNAEKAKIKNPDSDYTDKIKVCFNEAAESIIIKESAVLLYETVLREQELS